MSLLISSAWSLIPIAVAASLTYNWQSETPPLFAFTTYKNKLLPILDNPQATGVRYYLGLYDEGNFQNVPKIMIVGVDAQGNDIIDQTSPDSKILNFGLPCPTLCDKNKSQLLHDNLTSNNGFTQVGSTRPIPFAAALNMTAAWQASQSFKSIYVVKSDLQALFQYYGQNQLRFYIAKGNEQDLQVIVVGVDQTGNDVQGTQVYVSEVAVCTGNENSCDENSPLYHN